MILKEWHWFEDINSLSLKISYMRNAARAEVEFGVTSHPRKVRELNTNTEDFPQVNC